MNKELKLIISIHSRKFYQTFSFYPHLDWTRMTLLTAGAGSLPGLLGVAARPGLLGASLSLLPGTGQVRFKRKIMVKRPHQPDWFRKQLLAVSKPKWDETVPIEEEPMNCQYVARREEEDQWREGVNQLEKFYVQDMMDLFRNSQMIGFFHTNPLPRCNFRKAWQNGRKLGMELRRFNLRVGKAGLRGTEWENCLNFFFDSFNHDHETPIIFSPEVRPKQLAAFEKKVPEFHLIGAVAHGRILSRKQLIDLNNVPDLNYQRQELVSILNANQTKLSSLLQSTQTQLSKNLEQLIKDKS